MDHVHYALSIGQNGMNGLHDIRFIHNPIPETSLKDISLSTRIGDLTMSSPILINAMTGGAEETEVINYGLGLAAHETGIAMAVGSQMSAIRNHNLSTSYQSARKANPNGILFANLGSEATPDQALRAIEMIQADAIQIHLNVVQELVMPEGDRSFKGMLQRIESIAKRVEVPLIVKEVGFGMTKEAVLKIMDLGVAAVDCGGRGGTNFAAIENARRDYELTCFNSWGNCTSVSLLETLESTTSNRVIASGGIRNGMEASIALSIGASCVGMAGVFLRTLKESGTEALIQQIKHTLDEIRLIMAALGAHSILDLQKSPLFISGETAQWCQARDIDIHKYARRTI